MRAANLIKSEQIEDILANFSEVGVNVVDTKEAELEEEVATGEEQEKEAEGDNELEQIPLDFTHSLRA